MAEDLQGAALSDDILKGVADITRFWLGSNTPANRRIISHQIEQKRLPIFRLGRSIFARKSAITSWIAEQEKANGQPATPPSLHSHSRR